MSEVKNIDRYWVDKESRIIVRKWTDEEYNSIKPYEHIFEEQWVYYCPICNFIPVICRDKNSAIHSANSHKSYTGHECLVECKNCEFVCLEFKDEFLEDLGVWVNKQEVY